MTNKPETGYRSANATFAFSVGNISSTIEIGGESGLLPKSSDDWKISLGIDAVLQISEKYNTNIKAVRLSLTSITLANEQPLD